MLNFQAILNPDHQIPFPSENVDPQLLSVIKACLTRDVKMRPSIEELLQHTYVTGKNLEHIPFCKLRNPFVLLAIYFVHLASRNTNRKILQAKVFFFLNFNYIFYMAVDLMTKVQFGTAENWCFIAIFFGIRR